MSFVICYCSEAFPLIQSAGLQDIGTHMRECPIRRQLSPLTSLVQQLDETATDQQRRILLAELRLELSNLQPSVSTGSLSRVEKPLPVQVPGSHPPATDAKTPNSAGLTYTCRVCGREGDLTQTACNHWLCTVHIRTDFESNYRRGRGTLRCPAPGCGRPLTEADLVVAVGPEALANARRLVH